MWITRLRVTGGYLADLDVRFTQGLNVIVGPRGAGKTTLLELIRHALGVRYADASRAERQERLIKESLGTGEVILDIEDVDESHQIMVDAAGNGRRAGLSAMALMVGQNELESIASDSKSRLNLIDLRAQIVESSSALRVASIRTREAAALRERVADLGEQLQQTSTLRRDFAEAQAEELQLLSTSDAQTTEQRRQLAVIEDELATTRKQFNYVTNFSNRLKRTEGDAETLLSTLREISGPNATLDNIIGAGRLAVPAAAAETIKQEIGEVGAAVGSYLTAQADRIENLRSAAVPLRSALEEAERGLGDVTARVRNLRNQLEALELLEEQRTEERAKYAATLLARDLDLDDMEVQSRAKYDFRQQVATAASTQLGGRVTISVGHLADTSPFLSFLLDNLQGSGLKYSTLANTLAGALLPRQLLNFVEQQDAKGLANAAGIAEDRAFRLCAHLNNPDLLAQLADLTLEDHVDFLLLDGSMRKSVETLSTGQKCAVTLPILLTEHDRTLVMDQPEDHLDNAYLVGNIVSSILKRNEVSAQTIVATHNANIPVLGSAEMVVALASDGRRGFVSAQGSYEQPQIIKVITTLMEGGLEAFERRAAFYRSHADG